MDDDYAGVESSITYSATLNNQKVVNENDRYTPYKSRSGMEGMATINLEQKKLSTDTTVVPAVFHDQIRAELIAEAKEGGAYSMSTQSILTFHC